jgi:photosystem II stability/assembly factor-like uncharacterized protein
MKRSLFTLLWILVLATAAQAGDGVWTNKGPDGGWADDIAFDPSAPNVVYAGTLNGPFKSVDGGDTWAQIRGNEPDRLPRVFATAVAVSPNGVVYIGTQTSGFFRSEDGGESWIPGNTGLENTRYLSPVVVDPTPPHSTLFLVSRGGSLGWGRLFRSDDGGQSWQEAHGTDSTVLPPTVVDLVFHAGMLYAASRDGVFKTADGGVTWHTANGAWPNTVNQSFPRAIAASGDDALFLGTGLGGVYRSDDQGDTWQRVNGTSPDNFPYSSLSRYWIRALAVDAHGTLYVGGSDGMYTGVNGGEAWSRAILPYEQTLIEAVAPDPEASDRLIAGGYPGAAIRSTDSGATWAESNTGIRASGVSRIPNDLATPARSFTVSTLAKTPDAGESWEQYAHGLPSSDHFDLAIWPGQAADSPSRFYIVADSWVTGIYGRDDGDSAWTPLTPPVELDDGARLTAVDVDPTNRDLVFVGQYGFPGWVSWGDLPGGLFRSMDGGSSWTAVYVPESPQYPDPGSLDIYQPNDIAVDPRNPRRIYATAIWVESDYVTWGWHVLRSTDGGETWHEALSESTTDSQFRYLALDPNDPSVVGDASTIYVYDSGEEATFRSRDGGDTWSPVGGSWLTVDPHVGGVVYAGFLDNVVRMSEDRGETWTPLPMDGFDNEIRGIGIAATSPPVIHLGSWGGVYSFTLVPDEDGDGVVDDEDYCPGTVIPESVPYFALGINRWALVDDDNVFDTVTPPGVGTELSFTISDTAGCSCEQIIEERGLGVGQRRRGCSTGVMQSWNPTVDGSPNRNPVIVIQPGEDSSIESHSRRLRSFRRPR